MGIALLGILSWRYHQKRNERKNAVGLVEKPQPWSDSTVGALSWYPTRMLSRVAGSLSFSLHSSLLLGTIVDHEFSAPIQTRLIRLFAWWFGCDLTEQTEPVESYKSLGQFFKRHLKKEVRPIAEGAHLVGLSRDSLD